MIDTQGIIQPYIDGTGSMFEGKVTCIKEIIDASKRPLFAIGDTLNDLAMLEYSSHAIIRDKGDTLSDIAKERDWLTLIS
jgi:phosphoserine phosphatase